jgi:hypothetical protein
MTITEALWNAIETSVLTLPHRVEWFEPDGSLVREINTMFVVPRNLVDLFGEGVLFEKGKELAAVRQCEYHKANDGSLVFRVRG